MTHREALRELNFIEKFFYVLFVITGACGNEGGHGQSCNPQNIAQPKASTMPKHSFFVGRKADLTKHWHNGEYVYKDLGSGKVITRQEYENRMMYYT